MENFNFKKAFKNDGILFPSVFGSLLSFGIGIYFNSTGEEIYLYIILTYAITSLIVFIARMYYFNTYKNIDMIEIEALVIKTVYYRGVKRIKMKYNINGVEYIKKNALYSNKLSRPISKGENVILYYKASNPKHALIKKFYFEEMDQII